MNYKTIHSVGTGFLLFIVFLGLVACQSIQEGIPEVQINLQQIDPKGLEGLNGRRLIEESAGNCTIDQLEAREEGFRALGSVGGLAVNFPESLAQPVEDTKWVANRWKKLSDFGLPSSDVAIMVVDDFRGGTYTLGSKLFELTYDDLEGDTADEKIVSLEAFVNGQLADGELSHGALVMESLIGILDYSKNMKPILIGDDRVDFRRRVKSVVKSSSVVNKSNVIVQAVDTESFKTDIIAENLISAMSALSDEGVERFVVNASFSIVPCSVLIDYEGTDALSFEEYIALIAKNNDLVGFEQDILEITVEPIENDPLENLFSSSFDFAGAIGGAENITIVASSGNYQLDFALSPARLENVVAVSSSDVKGNKLSSFSNSGQVRAFGAWLELSDSTGRNGFGQNANALVLAGTSFASPATAAFLALDLTQSNPDCNNEAGSSLFLDAPDTKNLKLKRAFDLYCNGN